MKNLIIFTIDENYIEPFIVAIESFSHYHEKSKYAIALVYSDIKNKKIKKIKKYFLSKNLTLITKKINDVFGNIKVDYHFNSVIFYRLLLPSIFSNYKKILYLDSDILFTGNIDTLFEIDLRKSILAAIPKHLYMEIPRHIKKKTYFASGLLLINNKEFLENNIYEKCINFLQNEDYEMPDQDALNVSVNKWIELELNYGVETAFLESNNKYLKKKITNPKIIQFSGSSKPWHFRNQHPYKHLYWKYLRMTPFKRYIPEDLTVVNVIKWMIPKNIKEFIKGYK